MLCCLLSFSTERKKEVLPFALKCSRALLLLFPGCWLPSLRSGAESGKGRAVGEAPAAGSHFCLAALASASKTMGDGW